MKKKTGILIAAVACLLSSFAAHSQGVNFRELTLDQALAAAQTESKLVMVDCQTSWCGPCKHMSNNVFPTKEAGEFFNKHFVCVEFDMEKGEGLEIGKKYGVRAYPTFLILNPTGAEQYRVVGAAGLDEFIPKIKRGLDPKNSREVLDKEYASGKMKKEKKLAYLSVLQDAYDTKAIAKVRDELLNSLTTNERLSATYWPLIENKMGQTTIENLEFVTKNRIKLEKNVGKQKVNALLNEGYISLLDSYIAKGKSTDDGEKLIAGIQEQVIRKAIEPNPALDAKLKIAAVISSGEGVQQVIALVAENAKALSINDLLSFSLAVGKLDTGDKALMEKMVQIGEAIIEKSPESQRATVVTAVNKLFAQYHKALATGVYWESLTLQEALDKAKAENKHVFMDCYTTWCGPCAYMAKTVFTRPEVGEYFNEHFINVKYDMEEGEGIETAKQYNISSYPTFVILRPDGSVQHKIIGSSEDIVAAAKKGLDDAHATGTLDRKYAGGNRDKDFLISYFEQLVDLSEVEKAQEVYGILQPMLDDSEKSSKRFWFLYESDEFSGEGSDNYKYLLAHRKNFEASVGKEIVDERIMNVYKKKLYPVLLGKEKPAPGELKKLKKEVAPFKLTKEKELFACIEIVNSYAAGDPDKLLKVASKELKNLSEDNIDIAIFTLNYLKNNTTGKIDNLKAIAGDLKKKIQFDEFKQILDMLFQEQVEVDAEEVVEEE
ncbi:MAG: thioredoxin family protein [Odoribacteraceae bacterium]|jgi:thiol-disulfide isomerase/thioredoxin|nr:thioredoxin family protein [Odoribacteraceae bacterium]